MSTREKCMCALRITNGPMGVSRAVLIGAKGRQGAWQGAHADKLRLSAGFQTMQQILEQIISCH